MNKKGRWSEVERERGERMEGARVRKTHWLFEYTLARRDGTADPVYRRDTRIYNTLGLDHPVYSRNISSTVRDGPARMRINERERIFVGKRRSYRRSHGVTSIALPRKRRVRCAWRVGTRETRTHRADNDNDRGRQNTKKKETKRNHWCALSSVKQRTVWMIKQKSQTCPDSTNQPNVFI